MPASRPALHIDCPDCRGPIGFESDPPGLARYEVCMHPRYREAGRRRGITQEVRVRVVGRDATDAAGRAVALWLAEVQPEALHVRQKPVAVTGFDEADPTLVPWDVAEAAAQAYLRPAEEGD